MGWGIPNPNEPEESWYPPLGRIQLCTGGSHTGKQGKTWITRTSGVLQDAHPSCQQPAALGGHGTGAIGCYSRHYWVVSLDSLLRGFEAAFGGFLQNPSRRQIAISEQHPGARLGPDPEATI